MCADVLFEVNRYCRMVRIFLLSLNQDANSLREQLGQEKPQPDMGLESRQSSDELSVMRVARSVPSDLFGLNG